MVSYPRRPKSGHITCYLNRTYHLLPTFQWYTTCIPLVHVLTFRPFAGAKVLHANLGLMVRE